MFLFDFSMSEALTGLMDNMLSTVPKIIGALAVFIIGWLIAKMIRSMIAVAFGKMGIDKLGDKLSEIDIVDKSNIKIKISSALASIVYYIVLLFVIMISTAILDLDVVSDLVVSIFEFVPKLLTALIILVLGTLLADGLKKVVHTACNSLGIPSAKLISSFLFYFLLVNILVSALAQAEINTEFLSRNISILIGGLVLAFAIGYGLSSRNTMSNYLASFYTQERFNLGDRVTFDGTTGLIIDINKTSMTLDTGNSRVILPLSKVTDSKIEIHN
jgi:hypothetical protein